MTFFGIFLGFLTAALIIVSILLCLVVLMQKASADGGMGAAMGGGMAEATFGAETNSVLSRVTKILAVIFFVLSFVLYLGRVSERKHMSQSVGALPSIAVPVKAPASAPAPKN